MMKENNMLQLFALNKIGDICHVDDVVRGLACECSCPKCGEAVLARQGEIRGWHFAHSSGADCVGGAESALHLAAKQMITKEMGMMVPEVSVSVEHKLSDGRVGQGTSTRPEMWLDFMRVELEQDFAPIRPDVVTYLNDGLMFVEIAVTHFVDQQKSEEIRKLAVPTLEVDISELRETRVDWSSLKGLLVDALHNKVWIHPLAYAITEAEAIQSAVDNALRQSLVIEQTSARKKHQKHKYIINSRTVYLTEHSYSVRVWIQPDMAVVNVVKPMLKELGGNYKKHTNDWWFPVEAARDLHDELAALSSSNNKDTTT